MLLARLHIRLCRTLPSLHLLGTSFSVLNALTLLLSSALQLPFARETGKLIDRVVNATGAFGGCSFIGCPEAMLCCICTFCVKHNRIASKSLFFLFDVGWQR